jgi:hypothetical protein
VRFVRTLSAASNQDQLKRNFLTGFGRLLGVPMYGYALVDSTGYPTCVATGNVSPTFVARYERDAKDVDPVLALAYDTGKPTYNLAIMAPDEWLESDVYRLAYCVHDMRHVVEVPVRSAGKITGNVHFATSDPDWGISSKDIRLADALGDVVALTLEAIEGRERVERDQALAVLDLAGTAFAVSDPLETEVCTSTTPPGGCSRTSSTPRSGCTASSPPPRCAAAARGGSTSSCGPATRRSSTATCARSTTTARMSPCSSSSASSSASHPASSRR